MIILTKEKLDEYMDYYCTEKGELLKDNPYGKPTLNTYDVPAEIKRLFVELWTKEKDNVPFALCLVEYIGEFGITLEMKNLSLEEAKKMDEKILLPDDDGHSQTLYLDAEENKYIVFLPWNVSKEDFDKVLACLC